MDIPDRLMGYHPDDPDELCTVIEETLLGEGGIHVKRHSAVRNAGEVRYYEDTAENKAVLLIPLPHLDIADVTVEDVNEWLGLVAPPKVEVEAKVAPPPTDS